MAYRLDLPIELSRIHNAFHVSNLRKCLVSSGQEVPLPEIQVDERLNYVEEPEAILDFKVKVLRNKTNKQVNVQWRHHRGQDATWESESVMRTRYPHLFV